MVHHRSPSTQGPDPILLVSFHLISIALASNSQAYHAEDLKIWDACGFLRRSEMSGQLKLAVQTLEVWASAFHSVHRGSHCCQAEKAFGKNLNVAVDNFDDGDFWFISFL